MDNSEFRVDLEGKVINAITEFHNLLEDYLFFIGRGFSGILPLIGLGYLLGVRLGWPALSGVLCLTIFQIIHFLYSQLNSRYLERIGHIKDKRMHLLSQIVFYLKYIKMQLWEKMFLKQSWTIRNE